MNFTMALSNLLLRSCVCYLFASLFSSLESAPLLVAGQESTQTKPENEAESNSGAIGEETSRNFLVSERVEEIGFTQSIEVNKLVHRRQSPYQLIEIYDSKHYGRILVLDGVLQITELDAAAYNEMMAHMPVFSAPHPERVLVIGGGDGYVVSEVLKHESVTHVDWVDLDGEVMEACRDYFNFSRHIWNDPRVHIHVSDGSKFVRDAPTGFYDAIVQDSSDPWTFQNEVQVVLPSQVLYTPAHIKEMRRILNDSGVMCLQAEMLQIPADLEGIAEWRQQALDSGFNGGCKYGSILISSYPTGQIGFLLCQVSDGSTQDQISGRYQEMLRNGHVTRYYHPALQTASFVLPLWAEKAIYGAPIVEAFPLQTTTNSQSNETPTSCEA